MSDIVTAMGAVAGFLLLYGLLGIGVALLVADMRGRLHVPHPRARILRWAGAVSAFALAVLPAYALFSGSVVVTGRAYELAATSYLVGGFMLVYGALRSIGKTALIARRAGLLIVLAITAIPSAGLLPLATMVPFAGLGLVRDG